VQVIRRRFVAVCNLYGVKNAASKRRPYMLNICNVHCYTRGCGRLKQRSDSSRRPVCGISDKKLSYHRGTARRTISVEILSNAAQLYDKLPTPPLNLAPPYGVTPLEFRRNFRPQRTKVSGLSHGVVCVILCLAALVQCRLMSDGRTDGRHTTTAYTALA